MSSFQYAVRSLTARPGFLGVAICTIALGIGVSSALFSVVNSVLLRPLHYPESERIVSVQTRFRDTGQIVPRIAGPELLDIRNSQRAFEAISFYRGGEAVVQLGARSELAGVCFAPPEFFKVFALQAVAGGWFTNANEMSAVVSEGFANRHFGGAPAAIGKLIDINGRAYEVRGVAPMTLDFPAEASVWVPSRLPSPTERRSVLNYSVLARLTPDARLESALEHLRVLASNLESTHSESRNRTFHIVRLRDYVVGRSQQTLKMLMAAGFLVLLICCANVANLTLAQATRRYRELAVRAALGARRWDIIHQLTLESVIIACVGGIAGFIATRGLLTTLLRFVPDNVPRINEVRVDAVVFTFTAATALLCSLIFGLLPAWTATAVNVADALKQNAGRQPAGSGSPRMRAALLIAEIGICFSLAVGAGLLLRSYLAMNRVNLGFNPDGVIVSYAHVPARSLDQQREAGRRLEALVAELSSMPGVESASAVMGVPAGLYSVNGAVKLEKMGADRSESKTQVSVHLASPGYFRTMQIQILRGRDFDARDGYEQPFVAIISQSLARQLFPGEDPIGRRIQSDLDSDKWMTIVGIVADIRQRSPYAEPEPELYMPVVQHPMYSNELQLVTRVSSLPEVLPRLQRAIESLDSRVAVRTTTLSAMLGRSMAVPRFRAVLVTFFAGLALVLALVGIYCVMTYVVAQRTSEIGIRTALGATPGAIKRSVLVWAIRVTLVGATAGTCLALITSQMMSAFLYGVQPVDAASYGVALAGVLLAGFAGAIAPAWRASAVDPIIALKG